LSSVSIHLSPHFKGHTRNWISGPIGIKRKSRTISRLLLAIKAKRSEAKTSGGDGQSPPDSLCYPMSSSCAACSIAGMCRWYSHQGSQAPQAMQFRLLASIAL